MIPDLNFSDSKTTTTSEYDPQNKWRKNTFEKIFLAWFKSHSEVMSKQWKGKHFIVDTLTSTDELCEKPKDQWLVLRDQAEKSWGCIEEEGLLRQGIEFAPEFWSDFKKNPFVVEAAVGFVETFPVFNIVPVIIIT
jgi:hypothetical protein